MAERIDIVVMAHDSASGVLGQIGGAFGSLGSIITGIESALNLAGQAFDVFKGLAMDGLQEIAGYERLTATIETLVAKEYLMTGAATDMNAALAISGERAQELIRWNQQLAIESPFTSEGVTEAFRMSLAYGFNIDQAKRLTEAMLDFAAGSGQSEASMQAIARALGQMSATGRVLAGDMMQLTNVGLPVTEILADGFGVTTAEFIKMREQGIVPAQEAIEIITTWLETNFAGAGARQAETWAGLLGTFEDLRSMGLREFFGGVYEAIKPLALEFTKFMFEGGGLERLSEWGNRLGALMRDTIVPALEAAFRVMAGGGTIMEAVNKGFETLSDTLDVRSEGITGFIARVANSLAAITEYDNILDGLFSSEFGESLVLFFGEENQERIFDLQDAIEGFVTRVSTAFQSGGLRGVFDEFFGNLGESRDFAAMIQSVVDSLTTAMEGTDWTRVGQTIADIITGAIEIVLTGLHILIEEVNWGPFGVALRSAIGEVLGGLFSNIGEYVYWDNWVAFFKQTLPRSIIEGLRMGILGSLGEAAVSIGLLAATIINKFKEFFGIGSPSTVFAQFARDMIAGLILGWTGAIGSFLTTVTTSLANIFSGAQATVTGGASATVGGIGTQVGTVGGRNMGGMTTDTRTGSGGGAGGVVNNYYGPVYFTGAGEPGAYYECPTDNPIVTSQTGGMTRNRPLGGGR